MAAKKRVKKPAIKTGKRKAPLETGLSPAVDSTDSPESLAVDAESSECESPPPGVPVVGLVASAGGLDAFKKFFTAMPTDSGVGFVVIPHLDPKHESLMVELLGRHTAMPIVEAGEGMAVEANHLYILPPNKYMTIAKGVLHLTGPVERTGPQTSIDLFLRSLAIDKQEKAIGIILSGTGSHGTLGLKAIKAADGMAMVQDPNTAEYPRMPQSAVATGLADFVLAVEKMPAALTTYVQSFFINGEKTGGEAVEAPDHLNQILALLRTRSKFDFRCYRTKMLTRRIERRMSLNHFDQMSEYLTYLREQPDEVKQLTRDLLISVTNFFRDSEAFETLERDAIARIVLGKDPDAPVRVWSAGCATGEEPYSLGMLVLEQLVAAQKSGPVQIFATDVSEAALEVARQGIYADTISTDVSPERLKRFFICVDDAAYRVNKQLREIVIFARQNIISDAPFSKLDLICCRNLLIYLEPEVQRKVLSLLHFSLNEGGFLFLGPSETIGRHMDLFEPISKKCRIFRRIGPSRPERVEVPIAISVEALLPARHLAPLGLSRPVSFANLTHSTLLAQYAPAAVLINRKYEILYFFGPTDRYLTVPAGEPTQDLMMLARDGLRSKLRSAIHKAMRENGEVTVADAQVKHNGGYQSVNIKIRPIQGPQGADGLLLVTFQDSELDRAPPRAPENIADESVVRQLEYELKVTHEDLQSTIEELESSNEELKVSNEEIMSMNEELQSANEELETSKEELQSLNEELSTVNNQLHEKVVDVEGANNDMANLLNCTNVAILFLDYQLRIKRFTRPTTRLFNLIATDLGRPISDITPKFSDGGLLRVVEKVLHDLTPQERQMQTADGAWWSQRIVPYRTLDNRIEGVVLTFTDITHIIRADEQSRRLATVLLDSNDAVIVHDFEGKITAWNHGAEHITGYTETEALSMNIKSIMPSESITATSRLWERLKLGEQIDTWESQRTTKDGRIIDVWVTATALKDATGRPIAVAITERDVTERKRAESEQQRTLALLDTLVRTAPIGFCFLDRELRFVRINERLAEIGGLPREAHLGRHIAEVMPRIGEIAWDVTRRILETGEAVANHEFSGETPAAPGVQHFWNESWYPVRDGTGEIIGFGVFVEDITERKRAEAEREKFVSLANQSTEFIAMADLNVRPIYINDAGWRLVGLDSAEAAYSMAAQEFFFPEDRPFIFNEFIPQVLRDGHGEVEMRFRHFKTGEALWMIHNVFLIQGLDGKSVALATVSRNITERKFAEESLRRMNEVLEQRVGERTIALRDREARLQAILDSAADAIITFDAQGVVQSANRAAELMFGGTVTEMIGQHFSTLLTLPFREGFDHYVTKDFMARAKKMIGIGQELVARRKDGTQFPTDLMITEVEHLQVFTAILRDLTARKRLEREIAEIAALEQQRIGQHLHDECGQQLTALGILADSLAQSLKKESTASAKVIDMMKLGLNSVLRQVRNISRGLALTEVGAAELPAALAELTTRLSETTKVNCVLECENEIDIADSHQATNLYHIAQEACTNALRHAQANKIVVRLRSMDQTLMLQIQDDGTGISTTAERGLGTHIMQTRAAVMGTELSITAAQPRGTIVTCLLKRSNHVPEK